MTGSALRRPLLVASIGAWLAYFGIYAVIFALSDASAGIAIRGALANAIPDGLLALAAFLIARRIDRRREASLIRVHASLGPIALLPAGFGKAGLLWLDTIVFRPGEPFRLAAGILVWQIFLSLLIYIVVAALSHAWLAAQRLREEVAQTARAEALRTRAEMAALRAQLNALRAQLNPHFLFNTLHSVLGLVRRDPALAERALEDLGDLLHYAIRVHGDGVDWTTLRDEWEFTRRYLDLETIRLGDRLKVASRIEDSALDREIPTFSLQPLVENAVRHGVAPRAAGGLVHIESRLEGDSLRLVVANDGDGATPPAGNEATRGTGLRVLRERLAALYGGRARMESGPAAAGGYRVVLILPQLAARADPGEDER